jgi:hypothetical protein
MITFCFWNLNEKPIQDLIGNICQENSVDVLILAECIIPYADLLNAINNNQSVKYEVTFSPLPRLLILTSLPHGSIKPVYDAGNISIRRVVPPIGLDITLVAAHLSSKLYQDSNDQALTATRLARLIEEVEGKIGHTRTIVIGDLNMNPFEAGVAGAEALHGVMSRDVARRGSRIIEGEERRFFYNPMWGRFGETPPGPPGTYFNNASRQINFFWNMFDQVLLRPELLDNFQEEDVEIITRAGTTTLVTSGGLPNRSVASDHLPILFRLSL